MSGNLDLKVNILTASTRFAVMILICCMPIIAGCSGMADRRSGGNQQTSNSRPTTAAQPADTVEAESQIATAGPKDPGRPPRQEAQTTRSPGTRVIISSVLMVDGEPLTAAEILAVCRQHLQNLAQSSTQRTFYPRCAEVIKQVVRDMILQTLLYKQIRLDITEQQHPIIEKAVDKTLRDMINRQANGSYAQFERKLQQQGSSIQQLRKQLQQEILTQQYLRDKFLPQVNVSRQQFRQYYQDNIERFSQPGRVHLHLIEIDAETFLPDNQTWPTATEALRGTAMELAYREAQRARQKLLHAHPFDQVAKKYSTAPGARQGGDLGWVHQGGFRIEQVSQVAFQLQPHQISEIIKWEHEFFIIKVSQIEPQHVVPFAQAQKEIRPELENQQYRKLVAKYRTELLLQATIGPIEPLLQAIVEQMPSYQQFRNQQKY